MFTIFIITKAAIDAYTAVNTLPVNKPTQKARQYGQVNNLSNHGFFTVGKFPLKIKKSSIRNKIHAIEMPNVSIYNRL